MRSFIQILFSLMTILPAMAVVLQPHPCPAQDFWPHFYPDDPILEDRDDFAVPEPEEVELSQYYDFIENTFLHPGGKDNPGAQNVNTFDEVPNSSWYTNRHGMKHMTKEELVRGPKAGPGPDTAKPWTVISGKSEGVTPGFVIRDSRGEVYFIKFDPIGNLEMATSAEAICTPFFHAVGYNVPENYLMDIHVNNIEVGDDATTKDVYGNKRTMTAEDLAWILDKAPVRPDGTLRVIASKAIPGRSIGHFRYHSPRPDDANDVIPHQHRRELRGLKLFAAWLNHDDTRSINSLDVYTEEGYVKHYLIDFGSCLGSGSVQPQTRRAGNEHMWEAGPTFKTIASLGLWVRPYLRTRYPDIPSIGRFESRDFEPELWRPEYPNPAFNLMNESDGFWAAKILATFTDEDIEAVVRAGMLSDPDAEDYLIRTLIERRDKICRYHLNQVNPLGRFELVNDTLRFTNLAVEYGFGKPPAGYKTAWWHYDNNAGKPLGQIGSSLTSFDTSVGLPTLLTDASPGTFSFVEITPTDDAPAAWQDPVRVFFDSNDDNTKIVGISR